jgi:hypothetical protein
MFFDNPLIQEIAQNPILFALLISIARNIGGWITTCFKQRKLVPWDKVQFLETLSLYETFFITLGGLANLPNSWTVPLTVIVDALRSLKAGIEKASA